MKNCNHLALASLKPSIAHSRNSPPRDDRQIVELFDRNKSDILSQSEAVELDRYLLLEPWVRLAKAHAYKHLQTAV
ncbi:hypothetical protein QUA42_07545 [Microcoleus sp. Pol11C2]|uniref:hypothetical protein n=1 Tax=Microcoleus sp. Pol11C2 TaxID=3055389 RepID=UPI002FD707C7